MTSTDRVISQFLRAVLLQMKALGLNQTSLAKRLNVSRPYVTKVLHGDVNITFGAALPRARSVVPLGGGRWVLGGGRCLDCALAPHAWVARRPPAR